jgi:hypothetical protein
MKEEIRKIKEKLDKVVEPLFVIHKKEENFYLKRGFLFVYTESSKPMFPRYSAISSDQFFEFFEKAKNKDFDLSEYEEEHYYDYLIINSTLNAEVFFTEKDIVKKSCGITKYENLFPDIIKIIEDSSFLDRIKTNNVHIAIYVTLPTVQLTYTPTSTGNYFIYEDDIYISYSYSLTFSDLF